MGAEDEVLTLKRLHQADHALTARPFLEVFSRLDRQLAPGSQRFDGLQAADVRAGEKPADRLVLEALGQRFGLLRAGLRQRPEPVVPLPLPAVTRLGMADDRSRHTDPAEAVGSRSKA